jgi:formylglycine-generating enzyme
MRLDIGTRARRTVAVDGFWIDTSPTTNREFAEVVRDTGHVTVAERPLDWPTSPTPRRRTPLPGSLVFTMTPGRAEVRHISQWWTWTPGACWRRLEGPRSTLAGRADHPESVSHIRTPRPTPPGPARRCRPKPSGSDRSGRHRGCGACMGRRAGSRGRAARQLPARRLTWRCADGYGSVGSSPANGFGLNDMAGNVWEGTSDWFVARHPEDAAGQCCVPLNPRSGEPEERVWTHAARR